jgi:hypothetical protein
MSVDFSYPDNLAMLVDAGRLDRTPTAGNKKSSGPG